MGRDELADELEDDGDDENNDSAAAEEYFNKGVKLLKSGGSPGDPYTKKIVAAIAAFTKAIELDEEYPNAWTKRGYAYMLADEYYDKKVMAELDAAKDADDPEDYSAQILANLDRAIELDEEDGDAFAYRAQLHWKCGRKDDALDDIQRAFDLDGEWAQTADMMYSDGFELPEEIIQGLRDEGYIEDEDDGDEEDEDED